MLRDGGRSVAARLAPARVGAAHGALESAVGWLCASHDVTGRQGSSKGFSLLHGWRPAYPETTGYVLGTLLEYAGRAGSRADLVQRAVEMGDWEARMQERDGGIMEGHVRTVPRRSIVFNTGMVLHGWLDLTEAGLGDYQEAAARASRFLTANMRGDGTWDPRYEFGGQPHTYNSRVAWAMLRWGLRAGDEAAVEAARVQLDWVCSRQQENGWFANAVFTTAMSAPSTHAIAYTMRGLLESFSLTGESRWLNAVLRPAQALMLVLERTARLPANYDHDWRPAAAHSCLTGTVQLGGVWLRLYQETGDARWLQAGLRAVEQVAGRQERVHWPPVRGAIAGSFPVWGRYAPLQYPNWATKFLADGLMLYDDCLVGSTVRGVGSVAPGPRAQPTPTSTATRTPTPTPADGPPAGADALASNSGSAGRPLPATG
jgi:hypothetical protein